MYLLIPIGIFAIALILILYLIGRKFIYLKKLTPEAINNPAPTMLAFLNGFFPEILSINWREYRVKITSEVEKIVRRLRIIFLKTESITHKLSLKLHKSK